MHHIVDPKVEGSISGLSSDECGLLLVVSLASRQLGEMGPLKCVLILTATEKDGFSAANIIT